MPIELMVGCEVQEQRVMATEAQILGDRRQPKTFLGRARPAGSRDLILRTKPISTGLIWRTEPIGVVLGSKTQLGRKDKANAWGGRVCSVPVRAYRANALRRHYGGPKRAKQSQFSPVWG